MATLKELYITLKSLRDMNFLVDGKLLKAADNLEEKRIKEEILPAFSQKIEPQLSEIQRDLVLVVEYHPGEPLSVDLSHEQLWFVINEINVFIVGIRIVFVYFCSM